MIYVVHDKYCDIKVPKNSHENIFWSKSSSGFHRTIFICHTPLHTRRMWLKKYFLPHDSGTTVFKNSDSVCLVDLRLTGVVSIRNIVLDISAQLSSRYQCLCRLIHLFHALKFVDIQESAHESAECSLFALLSATQQLGMWNIFLLSWHLETSGNFFLHKY